MFCLPGTAMRIALPGALSHRGFRDFTACRFILLVGVAAQDLGISISAYQQNHDIWLLYKVVMASLIPYALGSAFGGPLADRIPKRTLMMLSFGVQFAQAVVLLYLQWRGNIILPVLYIMLIFSNLIGGASTSAQGAILQEMFPSESHGTSTEIERKSNMLRNARFYGVFALQVSRVCGNLLVGVLPATALFAFNAIGFLPMLSYLFHMEEGRSVHVVETQGFKAAWMYLRSVPEAYHAFLWSTLTNTASGNSQVFVPAVGLSLLGGKVALSHLMAAFAVGGILGCLLGIWNTRKGGKESSVRLLLAWGSLLVGSYMAFEISSELVYAMAFFAISSLATAGVNNTSNSLITSIKGKMGEEHPEMHGRLQSFYNLSYCVGAVVFCTVTCGIVSLTEDFRWVAGWSLIGWLVILIGVGRGLIRGR